MANPKDRFSRDVAHIVIQWLKFPMMILVLPGMFVLSFEPTHEILALFVLRKFILQIRMRSHPVGLAV